MWLFIVCFLLFLHLLLPPLFFPYLCSLPPPPAFSSYFTLYLFPIPPSLLYSSSTSSWSLLTPPRRTWRSPPCRPPSCPPPSPLPPPPARSPRPSRSRPAPSPPPRSSPAPPRRSPPPSLSTPALPRRPRPSSRPPSCVRRPDRSGRARAPFSSRPTEAASPVRSRDADQTGPAETDLPLWAPGISNLQPFPLNGAPFTPKKNRTLVLLPPSGSSFASFQVGRERNLSLFFFFPSSLLTREAETLL